jgi:hypothetical protein
MTYQYVVEWYGPHGCIDVDCFDTRSEAIKMIPEYKMAFKGVGFCFFNIRKELVR